MYSWVNILISTGSWWIQEHSERRNNRLDEKVERQEYCWLDDHPGYISRLSERKQTEDSNSSKLCVWQNKKRLWGQEQWKVGWADLWKHLPSIKVIRCSSPVLKSYSIWIECLGALWCIISLWHNIVSYIEVKPVYKSMLSFELTVEILLVVV